MGEPPPQLPPRPPTKIEALLILAHDIYNLLSLGIRYGSYITIAYIVYLSIKVLAGQETIAQFVFVFFSRQKSQWLWPTIAALALIWALSERKLRHRKTKYLSKRIEELEKTRDPNRTSSGLPPTGETHPEDKP